LTNESFQVLSFADLLKRFNRRRRSLVLPIASQLVRDQMHHQFALGDTEPLLPAFGTASRRSARPVRRGVAATLRARRADAPHTA
jgi:hypothetical protein